MITKILIDKNTNDDWSSTSPFAGYTTSDNGFVICNIEGVGYTNYTVIPNLLLSMGSINRSVDVMSSKGSFFAGENILGGVGGLTKVGDWNFVLENLSKIISPVDLAGRKITVVCEDTVVFIGRIYKCVPQKDRIKFIVRSNFLLWDREIGTILNSGLKKSNNKIIPIIYGDFTTEDSYIPLPVDTESNKTIIGYTDEQEIKEISNIFVWDAKRAKADYCTNGLDDLTLNVDNTEITFEKELSISLEENITTTDILDTITLDECPIIGIQFTTSPSLTAGWVFKSTNDGDNYYRFVEKIGDVYLFEVGKDEDDIEYFLDPQYDGYESLKPSESANAFIQVSGGSSTYTVDNSSDITVPELFARQIDWNARTSIYYYNVSNAGTQFDYNDMVRSRIIQVDDEKMLIYQSLPIWTSGLGVHSRHEVIRGYSDTTKATHTTSSTINIKQNKEDNAEYILKMKTIIPVTALSNWRVLFHLANITETIDVYTGQKNVREAVDSFVGLNDLLNDFRYQVAASQPLEIDFTDFLDLTYSAWTSEEDIEYAWASLLLDIELGQTTSLDGDITGIWLLGTFVVSRPGGTPGQAVPGVTEWPSPTGIALGMRVADDTSTEFKRIGINLYNASVCGFCPADITSINTKYEYNDFNNTGVANALSDIVTWEANCGGNIFTVFKNNPIIGSYWEKCFPLSGVWSRHPTTSELRRYDKGTIEEPKMPKTLEDFYKQRFVLQLMGQSEYLTGTSGTHFEISNFGFLVEYTVDIRETDLWVQCKGRVDDADNLLSNPVDIIEDILLKETGLVAGDIDSTTFTAAASTTSSASVGFALYDSPIKSSKILETICKEHGLILGELPNGKAACFDINDATGYTGFFNADILLKNNTPDYAEGVTDLDKLITDLTIKYKERYTDGIFIEQRVSTGFTDTEDYLDTDRKVTVNAKTIRDSTSAARLDTLIESYYETPLRVLTVHCQPEYTMELVPGQWIAFDDNTYLPIEENEPYLIIETDFQPGYGNVSPKIELTLLGAGYSAEYIPETPVVYISRQQNIGVYSYGNNIGVHHDYGYVTSDPGNPTNNGDPASVHSLNIGPEQNESTSNIGTW